MTHSKVTRTAVTVFAASLLLICMAASANLGGYSHAIALNGDNAAYEVVAKAVRTGDFHTAGEVKHLWGLPYLAASLAALLHITELHAIAAISILSTIASVFLVAELWSPWVAAWFIAGSYALIQMGAFGGAEPLFVFLALASLRLARKNHWATASLLAALSTAVRPLGIFFLAGIVVRAPRRRTLLLGVAALVAAIYLTPQIYYLGNPLHHWTGYRTEDWSGGFPLNFPLVAILQNLRNGRNVGNPVMVAVKLGYLALHLVCLAGICLSAARRRRLFADVDAGIAVVLYSVFILLYNSPIWSLSIYPRLLIPILPMLLAVYEDWLPRSKTLLGVCGLLSAAVAVASNLGSAALHRFHGG